MDFDIRQPLFDEESGEYDEKQAKQYTDQVLERFVASPEGQALGELHGWVGMMLDYAFGYVGLALPDVEADSLEEILLDIFPRKVSTPPDSAESIVTELRAFWSFLKREFALENADSCLQFLNDAHTVDDLKDALADPSNYGPAKSMFMLGMERGFDMSSEEGINKWMATYNAEIKANLESGRKPLGLGTGFPWNQDMGDDQEWGSGSGSRSRPNKKAKAKRKAEKASRKKNRRR